MKDVKTGKYAFNSNTCLPKGFTSGVMDECSCEDFPPESTGDRWCRMARQRNISESSN
ncbi:hypothetical protein HYU13_01980 [Candidatus Woesearchaeota archaeon]|nr:hypothetical protein [Candidatus Woesearchaeota archaeon]